MRVEAANLFSEASNAALQAANFPPLHHHLLVRAQQLRLAVGHLHVELRLVAANNQGRISSNKVGLLQELLSFTVVCIMVVGQLCLVFDNCSELLLHGKDLLLHLPDLVVLRLNLVLQQLDLVVQHKLVLVHCANLTAMVVVVLIRMMVGGAADWNRILPLASSPSLPFPWQAQLRPDPINT